MSEQELLVCFDGRLARFKHPRHVSFCDALPRNAMAKVILADVKKMVRDAIAELS